MVRRNMTRPKLRPVRIALLIGFLGAAALRRAPPRAWRRHIKRPPRRAVKGEALPRALTRRRCPGAGWSRGGLSTPESVQQVRLALVEGAPLAPARRVGDRVVGMAIPAGGVAGLRIDRPVAALDALRRPGSPRRRSARSRRCPARDSSSGCDRGCSPGRRASRDCRRTRRPPCA